MNNPFAKIPLIGNLFKIFPIEVIVIEAFKGYRIKHDKMRRITDRNTGHDYYTFKSLKGEFQPLPYDKILPSDKGLTAILFSKATGQYNLVDIREEYEIKDIDVTRFENNKLVTEKVNMKIPAIVPIKESIRQTATVVHHRIDMRYPRGKTFFEKYALIIYLIVWALAIALPMLFYPTYLDAVAKHAGGVASQLQGIIDQLGIATQGITHAGASSLTPPPV